MSERSPALWFAVFVVFIDALGMSIIIPIMPSLLGELTGQTVAETAMIGGVLTAVYAVNQFLFGPIVGALSDRFGRRPLILLSLAALVVDYLLMAVAWNVLLLFIGRFLAGLAGASYTVATAYIADVSEKSKRSENFGLVGAAFGVGFIIGPVLGGLAAGIDVRAPLYLAAGICFVGVLFGIFILPESLKEENRRAFSLRSANPFSALMRAFKMKGLQAFLLVMTLLSLADFTYPAIWAYWGTQSLGWSEAMIGLTLAYYGIGTAIVQGGLIRWIIPAIGEPKTIVLGLIVSALSFFLFAFASQTWMVLIIIPISCLSHVAGAALTGMMTRLVSDSEQGELQGVLGAIGAVTSIVSSLVMTAIFFKLADDQGAYFPGGSFLVAGVLVLISFVPLRAALMHRAPKPNEPAV